MELDFNRGLPRRRRTPHISAGVIALIVAAIVAWFFILSWVAMLLIGGLHSIFEDSVPALGYGSSMIIMGVIWFLAMLFRRLPS